jgi:hypothetical protein
MLERQGDAPCFLCGASPARWNAPAIAADPGQAGREMAALAQRLDELKSGRATAAALRSHLLQMCAMCQEVFMDAGHGASQEDILSRLEFRVARLRALAREAG